ncbi:DUF1254 domain-containing protein [Pseudomonas sp. PCH199]|uniref:DUF1254 domain-containing protein n=1 Tax=unclassified Pseudomonas TaxID=196821 RepID=UPI000BC85105|nr:MULTISPECIES: DUF1254 domain-containing protein [unclassified Pseudomonas]MCW8277280.1 DUF1254 domain-containing protein [Pseudomonas sp. PCH199]PAM82494.1 carboxylesterase [Pseudomonas sp. ERMR1:02]
MHMLKAPLLALILIAPLCLATAAQKMPTLVTADNFVRAESDKFFTRVVARGGFGKFVHNRELVPVDSQVVIRPNRDTLYSSAVFDLDAGPVTVTLPDAGQRYFSLIAISEDQYAQPLMYKPGQYHFTRESIGTRYVLLGVRTLVDPASADDMQRAQALQDQIKVDQTNGPGRFDTPQWDQASLDAIRSSLLSLAATVPDSRGMFGKPADVDPVRHFIGSASAWGGNPAQDAYYLNVTPTRNDGSTRYGLTVKDVPVDGFWSISVYNAAGYFERNPQNIYTLNNLTAKRESDGSIAIQFGGCDEGVANCLPVAAGWNYMVRLYKPHANVLDGSWHFPEATPAD